MSLRPALVVAAGLMAAVPAAAQTRKGPPTAVVVSGPSVGASAPDFTLPWASRDGVGAVEFPYTLRKDRGKVVVLAFYPRDFTSSSTAEMRTFAEQYDDLFGDEVVVLGISTDSVDTHARFAGELNLPFRLLTDHDQKVARAYGSKDDGGRNRRTVYVIGADGKIAYRDLRFEALESKSYQELRAAVRKAKAQIETATTGR